MDSINRRRGSRSRSRSGSNRHPCDDEVPPSPSPQVPFSRLSDRMDGRRRQQQIDPGIPVPEGMGPSPIRSRQGSRDNLGGVSNSNPSPRKSPSKAPPPSQHSPTKANNGPVVTSNKGVSLPINSNRSSNSSGTKETSSSNNNNNGGGPGPTGGGTPKTKVIPPTATTPRKKQEAEPLLNKSSPNKSTNANSNSTPTSNNSKTSPKKEVKNDANPAKGKTPSTSPSKGVGPKPIPSTSTAGSPSVPGPSASGTSTPSKPALAGTDIVGSDVAKIAEAEDKKQELLRDTAAAFKLLSLCQKGDWHGVEVQLRHFEKAIQAGTGETRPLAGIFDEVNKGPLRGG